MKGKKSVRLHPGQQTFHNLPIHTKPSVVMNIVFNCS